MCTDTEMLSNRAGRAAELSTATFWHDHIGGEIGKSGEISCFGTTTRLGEIGKSREISKKVARGKSGNQ